MPFEVESKTGGVWNKPMLLAVRLIIILAIMAAGVIAQQPDKCAQVRFSERMTNDRPLRLNSLKGQAVYAGIGEKGELQGAAGLCVALFNRTSKQLVAGVPTDSTGQFTFASLAPGKYLLIVSMSELHQIVIPVEVGGSTGRTFKHWELMLHLRLKEDPKTSFVTPITQPDLRAELLELERKDQAVRNEMIQHGADRADRAIELRMLAVDSANTQRLKAIVQRYGWPGPDLVGADGANAAFMLVQHSPDLSFEQAMLPLVRRSYEAGKLSAWNYALLVDRLLVRSGKPQLYGMSVERWNNQEPVLSPMEDEANVDRRRAKIGLPPLREYLDSLKRLYFPSR